MKCMTLIFAVAISLEAVAVELRWVGKEKVENHHNDVPFHILERKYSFDADGEHKDDNGSENMVIHGDNLVALKSLLPKYEGRINCIYIDPPYNTGNENWVYNDNVNDPRIKKWLNQVVGKEGEDFTRHDKWLCMMYPRLRLLQKLLARNGVIFISIDDNEQANLRLVCDEIFGRGNFIGAIAWESKTKCQNTKTARRQFQRKWEYVLVYKNRPGRYEFLLEETGEEFVYDKSDERGVYRSKKIEEMSASGMRGRETMIFPILGVSPRDGFQWKLGEDAIEEFEDRGDLELIDGKPHLRIRPEDDSAKCEPFWSLLDKSFGTGESARKELTQIVGANNFETVKPYQLIAYLIKRVCGQNKNAIVLDSFAGSGATAHAVLSLNKHDQGARRFVVVELMDYAETLTAKRIKNVVIGYSYKKKKKRVEVEGTGGDFSYYELGPRLLMDDGMLNEDAPEEKIREYIYYSEVRQPLPTAPDGHDKSVLPDPYLLGVAYDVAYYFCYEKGRLTKLDRAMLSSFKTKAQSYVVYADKCELSPSELRRRHITFKKIPRDITRF